MSLQGSLETFSLPDVLVLLATTKKTGQLRVTGGRADGKVWVRGGDLVHSVFGTRAVTPVDAVFELLRVKTGTFVFSADEAAPVDGQPHPIDMVLADAQARLVEWAEIEKVVPHLDAVVDMAAEAPGAEIVISSQQWKLLVAVAGGRSVHDLMEKLGHTEFDTCRSIKDLVEAALATIDVDARPQTPAAKPSPAASASEPAARPPLGARPPLSARPEPRPASERPERRPASERPELRPASERPAAERRPSEDRQTVSDSRSAEAGEADNLVNRPKVRATVTPTTGAPVTATRGQSANPISTLSPTRSGSPSADGPSGPPPSAKPASERHPTEEEAKALVAQLAALGGEDEAKISEKVAAHIAEGGELPTVDGDEPINRGLLLKFLSSVRQ